MRQGLNLETGIILMGAFMLFVIILLAFIFIGVVAILFKVEKIQEKITRAEQEQNLRTTE